MFEKSLKVNNLTASRYSSDWIIAKVLPYVKFLPVTNWLHERARHVTIKEWHQNYGDISNYIRPILSYNMKNQIFDIYLPCLDDLQPRRPRLSCPKTTSCWPHLWIPLCHTLFKLEELYSVNEFIYAYKFKVTIEYFD